MHFIFAPYGSAGDVNPMIGLAVALRDRGHRITFLINAHFQSQVKRLGFDYVEIGTEVEYQAWANHPNLFDTARSTKHFFLHLEEQMIPRLYDALVSRYVSGETVCITNCFGFGALVAQEKHGVPVATLLLAPAAIWPPSRPPQFPGPQFPLWMQNMLFGLGVRLLADPVFCPSLNRFRSELGLPPVKQILRWWNSPTCIAALFPKWFCTVDDWPPQLIQTDFPLWDEREETLSADAEAFLAAGTPPIVFTPGSANAFGKRFFEAAASACQNLNQRGILLTRYPDQLPESLPEGVVHFSYLPFSQVLPRCSALVSHGGIGTISQGFMAGIPVLVVPFIGDQFDNAAQVKKLGVGDWLPKRWLSGKRMTQKLNALLNSDAVRKKCTEIASQSKSDGLERMAELLEERFSQLSS